jgi:glyoxylase-like metal-dependent hydrolase (beta-lactamase superfamily II)
MWLVVAALVLSAGGLAAQEKPAYEAKAIAPGIWELVVHDESGLLVKVIASVGDDGLLIVDSGYKKQANALLEALRAFGKGLPRYIINTHSHAEHLSGQTAFGKGPVIIGHRNLRDRYVNGLYAFNEFPEDALPQLTFTDSLSLQFNGEEIRLIAFPGAHDDSDIIVWFTKSKVVCTAALCNCHHFPSVDGETSGVLRYPETVARIIGILPEDVLLVPGHAEDCRMPEFRAFHEMLTKSRDLVSAELAKGKTLEQMRKADLLAGYASYESYMGRNDWLETLVTGLTLKRPERGTKQWPYGLLYRAYKEKGVDGAIQLYEELKTKTSEAYFLTEDTLLFAGRRMIRMDHDRDGIRLLEHWLKENPKGANLPLCHLGLASAHERLGNRAEALEYYRLFLASNPEEPSIRDKVKELEKPPAEK